MVEIEFGIQYRFVHGHVKKYFQGEFDSLEFERK